MIAVDSVAGQFEMSDRIGERISLYHDLQLAALALSYSLIGLSDESRWTRGANGRKLGDPCSLYDADRFCLSGSVSYWCMARGLSPRISDMAICALIETINQKTHLPMFGIECVTSYNDDRSNSHRDIVSLIGLTIMRLGSTEPTVASQMKAIDS